MSRAFAWAVAEQAATSASAFVLSILLVRRSGLELLGEYGALLIIGQLVIAVQGALITSTLLAIAPNYPKSERIEIFREAVGAGAIVGSLCIAVILCLSTIGPRVLPIVLDRGLLLTFAIWAISLQLADLAKKISYASSEPRRAFQQTSCGALIQFFVLLILPSDSINCRWVLGSIALANICSAGITLRTLRPSLPTRENVGRFWRSSRWLLGGAVLHWSTNNFVLLATASVLGPAALGAMRAAQNVFAIFHVVFQAMDNVLSRPLSVDLLTRGMPAFKRSVALLALSLAVASFILSGVVAIFGGEILAIFYSRVDRGAIEALRWYALIYPVMAIAVPIRVALKVVEDTRPIFISYCITSALTMVSAQSTLSGFGLPGALFLMLGAQAIPLLLTTYCLWRVR